MSTVIQFHHHTKHRHQPQDQLLPSEVQERIASARANRPADFYGGNEISRSNGLVAWVQQSRRSEGDEWTEQALLQQLRIIRGTAQP